MSLTTLLITGSSNTCFVYQQPHHCCPWAPGAWAALTNEEHTTEAPKQTHLCFASSQLLTIKLSTPDSTWSKDKSFILDLSAGKTIFAFPFFFFLLYFPVSVSLQLPLSCSCSLWVTLVSSVMLPLSMGLTAAWDVTPVWQAWRCSLGCQDLPCCWCALSRYYVSWKEDFWISSCCTVHCCITLTYVSCVMCSHGWFNLECQTVPSVLSVFHWLFCRWHKTGFAELLLFALVISLLIKK